MATNAGVLGQETMFRHRDVKEKHKREHSADHGSQEAVVADELLAVLGYKSELSRSRSTWQVSFMSFVLASVPYGLALTLYYPLIGGGPVAIIWGYLLVGLIMTCVAISLGEITSVFPTAGGVYYQTFMVSPPWCRTVNAWICGWAYTMGVISITLSVNFGTAQFFVACINIFTDAEGNPIWAAETYQVFLLFLAITFLCNAVSSLANRWLPMLDTFAIFWTFAGLMAIIICALAIAKGGRNSAEYVFTDFETNSGWVPGWSFFIGLLHGAYVTSATGMIISMCEEVQQPATQVPKAMVMTVIMNIICGLIFLITMVFVLPPIADVAAQASPVPYILSIAIGNQGGAFVLTIPILVLGLLCGTSCTTATSRTIWSFARDGAMPGSRWWKKVNLKLDVPFNAMMLSMVIQCLLGLIYFGSTAAFNAFSGVGVVFLTIAYTIPIAISLFTGRKTLKQGHYDFGMFGIFCNIVSICWAFLVTPLYCMPSYLPTTATTMNYASVVFVAGVAVSAIYYVVWGRKNYKGPPVSEEEVIAHRVSIVGA
ncbi:hypothetical protein LTR99_003050 [Exophiala xenobiotica]|uniref:Amino acid permease n=1 Tax=Vermiconidia calcicola TaxID=1690605 RepID=A0AAV9QAE2_9PEZI|nr:hypothetical protein LTR96_006663 [Exophiala xenobiotica]KAK5538717.1 hypothetical protein LTR25_004260 [Vermiconidia calcicola]KAK5547794.1 hypothetical protein LTR23_002042 [Chaetothyriales sp. CCFEE 6169]KAK5305507.1 hypothetical protein LTR99_003050 [Exophiala xenobiotica]KAK5335852.1 hypothetical protein LTR98_008067 [Exophiala xenobiotica]